MNIAHQGLPDGSTTWFYHTVNLEKGNNVVRVWSTNSDGGSLLEAVVQFTGVNSDNRDIKINADGSLLGGGGGRVTPNGIGAETPSGAQSKANAARTAAEAYAKAQSEAAELRAKQASDPKGSASAAQQAAIAAAEAKVNAAKVAMEAYADGVATDAEQAAIAAADAKANAAETRAKAYADGVVTEAESKAIAEADRLAKEAESRAKAASRPNNWNPDAGDITNRDVRWFARSCGFNGNQYQPDGLFTEAGVFNEKGERVYSTGRGIGLTVINRVTRTVDSHTVYDTYASTAKVNELVAKLNSLGDTKVIIITTYDEAANGVDGVPSFYEAMKRVGATQEALENAFGKPSVSVTGTWRMYQLIGIPSQGEGSGYEQTAYESTGRGHASNWLESWLTVDRNGGVTWGGGRYQDYVATVRAEAIKTTTEAYARAQAELAKTQAQAYADGEVTASEARAIAEAQKKADAAKAAAQQNLDNRIPQGNADALKTMMSNEGLRYYRKITIGGDANKYYPVIINGGNQDKLRTIKIWRGYSETAPSSWHTSTHKGALMLTWQGNFGGWGGATYRSTILEHSEAYTTILADCYIVNHSMGFAFFLRGGGAVYHIASDMDIAGVERTNPSGGGSGIYLDGTLNSYVHATQPYNAPDALTAVNSTRINDLKTAYNGKGQYIKNLNADNITAGKIAAQYVHADVYNGTLVNATNIKAGMLDADHINTRTFTGENAIFDAEVYGGVLTGAVVRTGSTGARAEMREDGYKFAAYNAQNKPTFYVDANGNVVMNSGSISSDVLSEASRNSNIVTWIGTAGKGGNMQFTDNLALVNDVTYFPITNNYYTTGKDGTLNVQYCAANGYLFQDEKSAVGAAAPAQKTLPADAAPTVYFVDASNTTKGAVIRMTIKYTTQAANGTAPSKTNPSGTQGWRKTYAHFHIDNIATRPNVAAGTNVKGYKLCINLGASSIKAALKALNRVPDVISYSEVAEGGRYLPHSYKLVWSGAANSVTNSWGSGWYMVQGHDRGDWHDAGFIFVLDENHYGSAAPRSIFPAYSIYYEYRYDTKIFKSSSGNITRIFKLTGV
ncbi:TPA: hypothetical protein NJ334_002596 [Vibrio parahaemolyticus]|nr:hypothetical protein [Vibrio parahaemolyticus]